MPNIVRFNLVHTCMLRWPPPALERPREGLNSYAYTCDPCGENIYHDRPNKKFIKMRFSVYYLEKKASYELDFSRVDKVGTTRNRISVTVLLCASLTVTGVAAIISCHSGMIVLAVVRVIVREHNSLINANIPSAIYFISTLKIATV